MPAAANLEPPMTVRGVLPTLLFALSAIIFYFMFGSWKGALFNFTEEILPGTDFIPSFTIMWAWNYFNSRKTSGINKINKIV